MKWKQTSLVVSIVCIYCFAARTISTWNVLCGHLAPQNEPYFDCTNTANMIFTSEIWNWILRHIVRTAHMVVVPSDCSLLRFICFDGNSILVRFTMTALSNVVAHAPFGLGAKRKYGRRHCMRLSRCHHRTNWWPLGRLPSSERHFDIVRFPRSDTVWGFVVCVSVRSFSFPFCRSVCRCYAAVQRQIWRGEVEKTQMENRNSHPNICQMRRCTGGTARNMRRRLRRKRRQYSPMALQRIYSIRATVERFDIPINVIIYDDVQIRWLNGK